MPRLASHKPARKCSAPLAVCGLAIAAVFATSIPTAQAAASQKRPAKAPKVGAITISPLPRSKFALPGTQVSFLGAPAADLMNISVVGTMSGRHGGRLRSYAGGNAGDTGASFLPSTAFTPGEGVTVKAKLKVGRLSRTLTTSFSVAQPATITLTHFPAYAGPQTAVQSFHSRPDLKPPTVTVTQPATGTPRGYLFSAPFLGPGQYGPMIFDNSGKLVWFRSLPNGQDAADFRVQTYKSKPALTWWQGETVSFGYGLGQDVIADSAYHTLAVIKTGNGLQLDEHEFLLTPQNTAFVVAYSPVRLDLSSVGGATQGIALDGLAQEIDLKTGLVMWEWHSLDNVPVSNSMSTIPGNPANPYDYFHLNSVDFDGKGNVLVSARNTWALYDISQHTGKVAWTLGGKASTVKLGAGVAFAYQHNGQFLGGNQIGLFDDESPGTAPNGLKVGPDPPNPPSRGEIIKLDTRSKTATLVAPLPHPGTRLTTFSQGNMQVLANGDRLVGFGGLPNFTEFNSSGQVDFDATLPKAENSYRTYRYPWVGKPTDSPAIVAKTTGGQVTVFAGWNGATEVASWKLLAGPSASSLSAVTTVPKSGFETSVATAPAAFYRVQALSSSGKTLGTSKVVAPTS